MQYKSMKVEKDKFSALIVKHKEEIKVKDAFIKSLQPKPIEGNIKSFNFGGKMHSVLQV